MLRLIQKLIANNQKPAALNPEERQERTRLAAAVLLLEAAHVDNECTEAELDHVIQTLTSHFDMSQEKATELIEIAHAEKAEAIDLWQFTNHLNEQYSVPEKIEIMEAVWRIIHADGKLDMHEDYFVHKLANLLRLTHAQMIEAKLAARDQLANG
jgi:uncharacterized tellurite resistance protein B-like protein